MILMMRSDGYDFHYEECDHKDLTHHEHNYEYDMCGQDSCTHHVLSHYNHYYDKCDHNGLIHHDHDKGNCHDDDDVSPHDHYNITHYNEILS